MKTKRKRKVLWLNYWQLEELEAWFMDMATEGWQLTNLGAQFATFEEAEPETLRYRCDVLDRDDSTDRKRMEEYRQAGWVYVVDRKSVHVFKEIEAGEAAAYPINIEEKVVALNKFKRRLTFEALALFASALALLFLQLWNIKSDPLSLYFSDAVLTGLILIIFLCGMALQTFLGRFYISKYINKLKDNSLDHPVNYKSKAGLNKIFVGITLFVLILFGVSLFINAPQSDVGELTEDVTRESFSIVRLTDVMDDADYNDALAAGEIELGYYFLNGSFLVPEQLEIVESDGGMIKPRRISSSIFKTRSSFIAKQVVAGIKTGKSYPFHRYGYQERDSPAFDEVWIYNAPTFTTALIIRQKEHVYYVDYIGDAEDDKEEVITIILDKIKGF